MNHFQEVQMEKIKLADMSHRILDEFSSVRACGVIYATNDYDLFTFKEGNRDVQKLSTLRKSIKKYGYLLFPIIVTAMPNGTLEIADGQHRFMVCKELGLPILFVEQPEFSIDKIQTTNSAQKSWNAMDYIKSKAIDSDDYKRFLTLIETFNFPVSVTDIAVTGSISGAQVQSDIKAGTLKCSEENYEKAFRALQWLSQFKKDVADNKLKGSTRSFYTALLFARKCKIVSPSVLANRVHSNFFKYGNYVATVEDAIQKTERAYNFNVPKGNTVDILGEYKKAIKDAANYKMISKRHGMEG